MFELQVKIDGRWLRIDRHLNESCNYPLVYQAIHYSLRQSVWNYVRDSVETSVRDTARDKVMDVSDPLADFIRESAQDYFKRTLIK
jgi:hypothetical protein